MKGLAQRNGIWLRGYTREAFRDATLSRQTPFKNEKALQDPSTRQILPRRVHGNETVLDRKDPKNYFQLLETNTPNVQTENYSFFINFPAFLHSILNKHFLFNISSFLQFPSTALLAQLLYLSAFHFNTQQKMLLSQIFFQSKKKTLNHGPETFNSPEVIKTIN